MNSVAMIVFTMKQIALDRGYYLPVFWNKYFCSCKNGHGHEYSKQQFTYTSNMRAVLFALSHKSVRILTPRVQCPHCGDLRV